MKDIKQQLKEFGEALAPSKAWQEKTRVWLMREIGARSQEAGIIRNNTTRQLGWFVFNLPTIFPKFASGITIFFMIATTGVIGAGAVFSALPGHKLYSLKREIEKVEVNLAGNPQAKTELQLELAGRRLEEAEKIAAKSPQSEKIEQTLDEFQNQVKIASSFIEQSPVQVPLAEALAAKTKEYEKTLEKTRKVLPETLQKKAREIRHTVRVSAVKAVELLVDNQDGLLSQTAETHLKDQMASAKNEVQDAEKNAFELNVTRGGKPDERSRVRLDVAKEAISDAEDFMGRGSYNAAISKMKKSVETMLVLEEENEQAPR